MQKKSKSARKTARKAYKKAVKNSKPGSGKRFSALSKSIEAEGKSPKEAKAIAASIGRKKYGAKKMASMSAKGRKK
jgi:hypothetical protein